MQFASLKAKSSLPDPYHLFCEEIQKDVDNNRVFSDPLHTLAYGTDASLYRITPKVVVKAIDATELITCVKLAHHLELPVTVRTAGTSLSGQALSDSILVALNWGFKDYEILEKGQSIRLEPAVLGGRANQLLTPFQRKIGPDPASIDSAMIGGIIANNSSGMCCGISQNSYQTLQDIKLLFVDSTILDTQDEQSIAQFKQSHSSLLSGLLNIRQTILKDKPLKEFIQQKYKIKNTTGYSLNAFVDFDNDIEILKHLIVGSEGTLAVILEAILQTVPDVPYKASALMIFDGIDEACEAAIRLNTIRSYVSAAELMDRSALHSAENKSYAPSYLKTLDENACALLVQCSGENEKILAHHIQTVTNKVSSLRTLRKIEFSSDSEIYKNYWKIRKGILPSLGEIRKLGTTYLIEDLAFPIEYLGQAVEKLQRLFKKYHYEDGVIIGHVLDGNIHFVICQDFTDSAEVKRYDDFTQEVVTMTLALKGSLKAEHSTGRNMSPFVQQEWGEKAYDLMKQVKQLFDPKNLLNPQVLINEDHKVYLKNFKEMPITHPIIDKCIECGFCERVCPSKEITLTPRQRIVVNRYLATASDFSIVNQIQSSYLYEGDKTCATCGLCEQVCPVEIDTGLLTKVLRQKNHSKIAKYIASFLASNFSLTLSGFKAALSVGHLKAKLLGAHRFKAVTQKLNHRLKTPIWLKYTPKPRKFEFPKKISFQDKVVYFPSCISRTLSPTTYHQDKRGLSEVLHHLFEKAQYEVIYPDSLQKLCCGMPWSSKGFQESFQYKFQETKQKLIEASAGGKYPICLDTSPCTYTLTKSLAQDLKQPLQVYDSIEFAHTYLIDRLEIQKEDTPIAVHTVCSTQKMQIHPLFLDIANRCSSQVTEPKEISCCGFAGDKGFHTPELNASALSSLKKQVSHCIEGFSSSITCEMGLSEHSDKPYSSILYLLDRCSKPKITKTT